jgi:hypothetical protein
MARQGTLDDPGRTARPTTGGSVRPSQPQALTHNNPTEPQDGKRQVQGGGKQRRWA